MGGIDAAPVKNQNEFVSAFVTNSRLMGVLVVYIRWRVGTGKRGKNAEVFHQFFYIETTEIGIEAYQGINENDEADMLEIEQAMIGGLGAKKIDISKREAFLLIQQYARLNEKYGEELPPPIAEYEFILNARLDASSNEETELLLKTCEPIKNRNQLIHYFLMRYFAGDESVLGQLADIEFPANLSEESYAATLCQNRIEKRENGDEEVSFICESLIETETDHRIIISELTLADERIASFDIISDFPISNAETAMKLERPEFITVYEAFLDADDIQDFLDKEYPAALKRETNAGKLYLSFNETNHHLQESLYRLNDDVKGMLYITDEDQLILAAYSLPQIHQLEREAQAFPFGRQLLPIAKYEFREDVFYDFVQGDSGNFVHFVEYLCDFDPDNDSD
jgi:hypothetical protein